jgi:hypothetical protein
MNHLHHGQSDRLGQALPAPFLRRGKPHPAAIAKLGVSLGKARRSLDALICQNGPGCVAGLVQRRQHVPGQLAGFFQDRRNQFGVIGLKARQAFQLRQTGDSLQRESHVVDRGFIGHQFISDYA